MIVFELHCIAGDHRFEGWFGSSDDFASQQARGLLACPTCGSADVIKAPMAPRVGRKGNQLPAPAAKSPSQPVRNEPLPPEAVKLMQAMHAAQAEALKSSRWVGDKFAEDARAMHYGEKEHEVIHGQATAQEAIELREEGVEVAMLPFPVAPPGKAN